MKKSIMIAAALLLVSAALIYLATPSKVVKDPHKIEIQSVNIYNSNLEEENITAQISSKMLAQTLSHYDRSKMPHPFSPSQIKEGNIDINYLDNGETKHIKLGNVNVVYESADKGGYQIKDSNKLLADINKLIVPEKTLIAEPRVDAPDEVQHWAQYEIDNCIRMLTVDGFFRDESQSGELIKIKIQVNKITDLQLVKTLTFAGNTTIDLYQLDFKLQPKDLSNQSLFTLDGDGWIASGDNFTYADAKGYELKKGQLYLLIHNDNGKLTSMGIRRAEILTDQWCDDLLAYYNYPPGVNFNLSEKELQALRDYWMWEEDWSFTMPCYNGYGDVWKVGLGYSHEWGIGIPYDRIGSTSRSTGELAAYYFATISDIYFDGLTVTSFSGFYGDDPDGPGFSVNQYIACTQPDCETSRGIHVGDTVEALRTAYPEIKKQEDYEPENDKESGIATHDSCWVYAPEKSNRSIMFLTKNDVIVQIDMADGLDGQYTTPKWTGRY